MFSYSHCALGRTDLSTSAALWSTAIAKKWIWQHEGKQKAFGRQIAFLDCAASGRQRRADGMTASDEEEVKRNNKNRSHKQCGDSAGGLLVMHNHQQHYQSATSWGKHRSSHREDVPPQVLMSIVDERRGSWRRWGWGWGWGWLAPMYSCEEERRMLSQHCLRPLK